MKTIATVLALFLVLPTTLWGAEAESKATERQVLEIQVKGMTCPFCAYGIEKNLGKLPGVENAPLRPLMMGLIDELTKLAGEMRGHHAQLQEQLRELTARERATTAYVTPAQRRPPRR